MDGTLHSLCGIVGNYLLALSGAQLRDEVSAWVTLIGSIAITCTTIGIQVYHLIRDRDKKTDEPADAENNEKESDEKNG